MLLGGGRSSGGANVDDFIGWACGSIEGRISEVASGIGSVIGGIGVGVGT